MNEQEQASRLAAWLDQPAGTRPPEGLDPDVVEALYALNPDLAPAPSLTADDILRGFDLGGAASADAAVAPEPVTGMPATPVTAAPESWRAANRVGGWMVVLATAATLLLVALPATQQAEPELAAPSATEVAAARRAADPIATVADQEPAIDAPPMATVAAAEPAAAPVPLAVTGMTLEVDGQAVDANAGDAVADAAEEAPAAEGWADKKEVADRGYAMQQSARFDGASNVIPEAEEALRARDAEDDAVASLDELGYVDNTGGQGGYAAPVAAAPATAAPAEESRQLLDFSRTESKKDSAAKQGAERKGKSESGANLSMPAQDSSSRDAARPRDLGNGWRSGQDAATLAEVDRALQIASTEAGLGNPDKAAEALAPHVGPPAAVGQYVAGVAARYWLAAGDGAAAAATLQRGLALSSDNTPWRAQLLFLYGELLQASGDGASAESYWQEAAGLNASR